MKKEIKKLDLTRKQYSVLGTLMMLFCVLLGAGVFFVADVSLPLSIVLAAVAVEIGFIGYCFRSVASEITDGEDADVSENRINDDKGRKNLALISVFLTTVLIACIIGVATVVSENLTKVVPEETPTETQTVTQNTEEEVLSVADNQNDIVFATPTGKRYHYSSECAGPTSFAITFEEAQKHDLTACMKCASEE